MLQFCVIKTSAELEAVNCTVSPLKSPVCFVSQTAASLSNAFIIAQDRVNQIRSSCLCVAERDTSTTWCCDKDWGEERWVFTRQTKWSPVQDSIALSIVFYLLRCVPCILFAFWRAADLLIVRSTRLLLDSR